MEPKIEVDEEHTAKYGSDEEPRAGGEMEGSSGSGVQSDAEKSQASTQSVTGSVIERRVVENGRTYCSYDYHMPNDEAEQTRLAITHQAFLQILDGQLSFTRIPVNVARVLDIGTGIGDWATAVAERFPKAEVIATDIAPFQPTDVPPNVSFEVDDAREEWTYSKPFDFIHIRGLTGAFSDWHAIYSEACKHLTPTGSLEIADFGLIKDPNTAADSYLSIFNGACQSAAEKARTPLGLDHFRKEVMEGSGLIVARSRVLDVPIGTWPSDPRKKVAGKMALISTLEGLEAMSMRLLTKYLGWKEDAVRDLCEKVKEELMKPGVRASVPCQFISARKLTT